MPYSFSARPTRWNSGALRPLVDRGRSRPGTLTAKALDCRLRGGPSQLRAGARLRARWWASIPVALFIDAADTLRRQGELSYFRKDEGTLGATLGAPAVDPAIDRDRAAFARLTPVRYRLN